MTFPQIKDPDSIFEKKYEKYYKPTIIYGNILLCVICSTITPEHHYYQYSCSHYGHRNCIKYLTNLTDNVKCFRCRKNDLSLINCCKCQKWFNKSDIDHMNINSSDIDSCQLILCKGCKNIITDNEIDIEDPIVLI